MSNSDYPIEEFVHQLTAADLQVVDHEYNHIESVSVFAGPTETQVISSDIVLETVYGPVQFDFQMAVQHDALDQAAVVSGVINARPLNDDLMNVDIFDDAWMYIGYEMGVDTWRGVPVELLSGAIDQITAYKAAKDAMLDSFTA